MEQYRYEVEMKNEPVKWVLFYECENKTDAGCQVWDKISNEGRNGDVKSVFCVEHHQI